MIEESGGFPNFSEPLVCQDLGHSSGSVAQAAGGDGHGLVANAKHFGVSGPGDWVAAKVLTFSVVKAIINQDTPG